MKIVQLVPWTEPVPPKKYGGTELVAYNITEELVRRGHEVHLIASGDSTTSGHLIPIAEKSFRELFPRESYESKELKEIEVYWKWRKAVEAAEIIQKLKPDIVHNHMSWRGVMFSPLYNAPLITTMHGPVNVYQERQTFLDLPNGNYVSISNNQRIANPDLNWIKTVYNGIDVNAFKMGEGNGNYFAFLGRTNPEKGLFEICQMIKKTKHKLKIAAKIDFVDTEYFETRIKPLIDGEQIEFLGEVDHKGKNELLKNAKALLLWLNWEEPFGLVVPEANVCGTPVVVNKRGSMPELIEHGKNGFLIDSLDEMQTCLERIDEIDRATCRQVVEQKFSITKMVNDYEMLYKQILN
ncbi:MAG: glycosyltransferase [Candidatus Paceibacter sp.]|jgi:glycosyltransferase involved in cell wall biosynthesis|nr:glycosyltransferase [Candidatus Paceibacter sp.]